MFTDEDVEGKVAGVRRVRKEVPDLGVMNTTFQLMEVLLWLNAVVVKGKVRLGEERQQ